MARKKNRKTKKSGARISNTVRKAKSIIKKHIAHLQSEKKKQENNLSTVNRELRELKSL